MMASTCPLRRKKGKADGRVGGIAYMLLDRSSKEIEHPFTKLGAL